MVCHILIVLAADKRAEEEVVKEFVNASWIDDRFDFDPEECNVANGKWVFNHSIKPPYSDTSCPYIERQFSCAMNGRTDSDYIHWEWQPEDCTLPRLSFTLLHDCCDCITCFISLYTFLAMKICIWFV